MGPLVGSSVAPLPDGNAPGCDTKRKRVGIYKSIGKEKLRRGEILS
jgi:hypothetical protein